MDVLDVRLGNSCQDRPDEGMNSGSGDPEFDLLQDEYSILNSKHFIGIHGSREVEGGRIFLLLSAALFSVVIARYPSSVFYFCPCSQYYTHI